MRYIGSTLLFLSLLFCSVSQAQETNDTTQNIFAALASRNIPAQLQGKDLTAAWRVMRADATSNQAVLLNTDTGRQSNFSSPWDDFYYTRGDVLPISGQVFLIAYRAQPPVDPAQRERQLQILRMMQSESGEATLQSQPLPLEENSTLTLSLVALGHGVSLRDIRAFDPATDLLTAAEKAKRETKVERAISQSNLKQVALALLQYVQDYDEKLPPMRAARSATELTTRNAYNVTSTTPVQIILYPYARTVQIFLHPKTGRPYLPNYKISRRALAGIEEPAATIAFFEDAPDAENMRNIMFLDGHIKAFSEAEFQKLRQAAGISESGLPSAAKDKNVALRQLEKQNRVRNPLPSGAGAPPPPIPNASPP
jgi:hypothetical protein